MMIGSALGGHQRPPLQVRQTHLLVVVGFELYYKIRTYVH
jgi:hypothetical protein